MKSYFVLFLFLLSLGFIHSYSPFVAAQESPEWNTPRTPWGDPDLMGIFTNKTITPVQRPEEYADREFLTSDEATSLEAEKINRDAFLLNRAAETTTAGGNVGAYNNFWLDWGTKPTGRTSLIIDPPTGRIPPTTPEFEQLVQQRSEERLTRGEADTWMDFQLNDRCIVWSAGPPMMPGPYNNTYMFFQTPDYVAIQVEMIHDTRIIPLDGRPHISTHIRQYLGDMRGHWEGDTLVVETTNIARTEGDPGVQGADEIEVRHTNGRSDDTIRIVERFTRISEDIINYQFTIEDQTRWTASFSGEFPFIRTKDNLYEYACHEGNYSMPNILAGERVQENSQGSK
tara:strand:+ start:1034 stop:2059 length:1026 start_codon:yes stop_codon:yes gene_type:complete